MRIHLINDNVVKDNTIKHNRVFAIIIKKFSSSDTSTLLHQAFMAPSASRQLTFSKCKWKTLLLPISWYHKAALIVSQRRKAVLLTTKTWFTHFQFSFTWSQLFKNRCRYDKRRSLSYFAVCKLWKDTKVYLLTNLQ